MSSKTEQLTQNAINFAARFGFLTKDIFFEYLCHNSKSQQYQNWKFLIEKGYFYSSKRQQGLLHLTSKGKKLAQYQVAPNKSLYTLAHDILVSTLLLELENTALVKESWTEFELVRDPLRTSLILGVTRIDKLPDLVVDLNGHNKTLRIAIEVENTLKSKERYSRIGSSYLNMKNINLVAYCCSSLTIQRAVRNTFSDAIFLKEQKSPISFLTEDFRKMKFETDAWLLNRKISLKNMLLTALEIDPNQWIKKPEKNRNPFRKNKSKNTDQKNQF